MLRVARKITVRYKIKTPYYYIVIYLVRKRVNFVLFRNYYYYFFSIFIIIFNKYYVIFHDARIEFTIKIAALFSTLWYYVYTFTWRFRKTTNPQLKMFVYLKIMIKNKKYSLFFRILHFKWRFWFQKSINLKKSLE